MTPAQSLDQSLLTPELMEVYKSRPRDETKRAEREALLAPIWEQTLSAGAKTYLTGIAREFVYGFHEVVSNKYMDKGIAVEDDSIALYNDVFFSNYRKNTERRDNKWLTGELDLLPGPNKITDIKSSWSLATFPVTAQDGHDSLYEWQGRGYMMLWDKDEFEIAYCMVNTPPELIRYEQPELHEVDHIPAHLRVTLASYARDLTLEQKIIVKCEAAQKFLASVIEKIKQEHNY
jgi:hypothetical protein